MTTQEQHGQIDHFNRKSSAPEGTQRQQPAVTKRSEQQGLLMASSTSQRHAMAEETSSCLC